MSYPPDIVAALESVHDAVASKPELGPPDGDWVLSEWVLVASWFKPDEGRSHMTRLNAPHMLSHHRTGLLHEAIKDDWDGPEDYEP